MIHKVKHTRRNRGLLLSTALALSSVFCTAHAAEKPLGAYRVINVRVGSALNVRAEHNSQSEDIGSASPGSRLYVVDFAPGGNWAKVKWDDGHGWVSARFLSLEKPSDKEISQLVELQSRQAQPTYTAEQLAAASLEVEAANTPPSTAALQNTDISHNPSITCNGNGVSWNLSLDQHGSLIFQAPDQNSLYATTQWRQSVSNKNTYAFAVADIKGTLIKKACTERPGNLNREWQLELQTNGFGGREQLSGCCQRVE